MAYIFKCMGCGTAGRVEAEQMATRGTLAFDVVYMDPRPTTKCWECGGRWEHRRIKATFDAGVACDYRCRRSTGASCTCSCGGEHHGRDAFPHAKARRGRNP